MPVQIQEGLPGARQDGGCGCALAGCLFRVIDPGDCLFRFKKGDLVRVKTENAAVRWRKPHLRTPGYIFGLVGTVERDCQART